MSQLVHCPICRTRVRWEETPYRPFCSERCRLIDLGAWIEERYRVPDQESSEDSKEGDGKNGEDSD